MSGNVAATPISSVSTTEALAFFLMAIYEERRREIDRLTNERAVLVEANRGLVAEREELRQRDEELGRRLALDSANSSKPRAMV